MKRRERILRCTGLSLVQRTGAPGCSSFVVRVETRHGRRRYLLHDLRNGECRRFTLAVQLQRWLRGATPGRLR